MVRATLGVLLTNSTFSTEDMMFFHEEPALRLAALALQAEKGDNYGNRAAYFRMENYVPARVSLALALCLYMITY